MYIKLNAVDMVSHGKPVQSSLKNINTAIAGVLHTYNAIKINKIYTFMLPALVTGRCFANLLGKLQSGGGPPAPQQTRISQQKCPRNGFAVFGEDMSAFSARFCRAHANCYEILPAFAAQVLSTSILCHAAVTEPHVYRVPVFRKTSALSSSPAPSLVGSRVFTMIKIASNVSNTPATALFTLKMTG
ncbi:MAG: hypothetical protein H7Z77_10100 [Chitinophagaceae bacterium]|nr:hypothetical protein [Polaromonas sp.]